MIAAVAILSVLVAGFGLACTSEGHDESGQTAAGKFPNDSIHWSDSMISRYAITDGGFRGIIIGMSKQCTVSELRRMDVQAVIPHPRDHLVIDRSADLFLLKNAEGVIWYPGRVRVEFRNDQIVARQVDPTVPATLSMRFKAAQTRNEVFDVLREILDADSGEEVGNFAPGARWVKLEQMTDADWELLNEYDAWELNHSDEEGYWHLRLEFTHGVLDRIIVQHSPAELP